MSIGEVSGWSENAAEAARFTGVRGSVGGGESIDEKEEREDGGDDMVVVVILW